MIKTRYCLALAVLVGAAACTGDDDIGLDPLDDAGADASRSDGSVDSDASRPDATTDASSDAGDIDGGADATIPDATSPDADTDAQVDPIRRIPVAMHDVLATNTPDSPSSLGFVTTDDAYESGGSSWRFRSTATAGAGQKFEFYIQLSAPAAGETVPPALAQIHDHLGDVTVADLESITVHSRRNGPALPDFTTLLYTVPDGDDDDATWFGYRLHAELSRPEAEAPASTWNAFSTTAGGNQLRFWDYRHANVADGTAPTDNHFTLADMQAGAVTPTGLTEARDYRDQQLKYLTLSTYSTDANFDGSIDGIEITLKNGKGVVLDLTGDSNIRQFSLSHAAMEAVYPASTGSSHGAPSNDHAWAGGASWRYVKTAGSPSQEKFEFYLPFSVTASDNIPSVWDEIRAHMGEFTLADLEAIEVHSRRNDATPRDFGMLIYTVPDGSNVDASWYKRKLVADFTYATNVAAPAETWNKFSTNAGTNQLRFWDFRSGPEVLPQNRFFTLAALQAGPIEPTGLPERDYRAEVVKYVTFSTFSTYAAFDASIDGLKVALKNGKTVILDLNQ